MEPNPFWNPQIWILISLQNQRYFLDKSFYICRAPVHEIHEYKNVSPRNFYEMALPLTKCWKYRNSVVKWQRWKYLNFKFDLKNSLTPLCQSPVDATSGYIFAKAIPILSYHKSRTIFSLVAIHIHTGKPYICEYTVWTPVYIWKI